MILMHVLIKLLHI